LMGDEGVGCRVAELCAARLRGVDSRDLGTAGTKLLHLLPGRRKVVVVDCARMGAVPAEWRRFTLEDAHDRGRRPRLSMHEGSLWDILELARLTGNDGPDIVIFGIEPSCVEPSSGLSEPLRSRLREYVSIVAREF
jgi:hydrogenase maturation protease